MEGRVRHERFYRWARAILAPPLKYMFQFTPQMAPAVDGPYIVVANHTLDLDALLVSLSFPKHMYFVASEHIFRPPVLGSLLRYFLAPIPKKKGRADVSAAMAMMRRLKAGCNIGLFPEGTKSFDGKPRPMVAATGSMVKASGASLVTYRLEGGYFTSPRWGPTLRRGRMRGYPVAVYSPRELAAMEPEEINRLIARDIGEDAYLRQGTEHVAFRGKNLAKGLENALYTCPKCGAIGTLKGHGRAFSCQCGLSASLDEMGMISGAPFDAADAWSAWQREELSRRFFAAGEEPLFSDPDQQVMRSLSLKKEEQVAKGTLLATRRGLEMDGFSLPWEKIMGMEVYGRNHVVFADSLGSHYRLISPKERSGLKYLDLYRIAKPALEGRE